VVRGTFSPARAWRPAVVARLPRTLGAVEMPLSSITSCSSNCRNALARSSTVAAPESAKSRPAQAGHGGPADTVFSSIPVAAAQRLGRPRRSATAAHEREGKSSVAKLARPLSAGTKEGTSRTSRLRGARSRRQGHLPAAPAISSVPYCQLASRQAKNSSAHAANGA